MAAKIISVLVFILAFIVPMLALFVHIFLRPVITGKQKTPESQASPKGEPQARAPGSP